ncbi:MAG: hypothetical protein AAF688_15010 [Bacteroidota bacterium]
MSTKKNILVIAPFAFGYTKHIHTALEKCDGVSAEIRYLDQPAFAYKNFGHRIYNAISKIFGKNLKKSFVFDRIKKEVALLPKQDLIFIIRPDILNDETLKYLKSRTESFIAYYYDSTRRFSRKLDIIPFFDKIYSYDKLDVEKYGFEFLTNFIFNRGTAIPNKRQFFNISTFDYRFPLLERLAGYLKSKNWTYKILVYNVSLIEAKHVEIITQQKSIEEVAELISESKIIVEIQRTEQVGLSFRIFEALGQEKKLITTNKDIVNYDFYHAQNILVINEDNFEIPEEFVVSPYKKLDTEILGPYLIDNWVRPIFSLE